MTKKFGFILIFFAATSGLCRANAPQGPAKLSAPWNDSAPSWAAPATTTIISEYDPVIRQVASDKGYDWRLISAIAMQESRFDHDVVSRAGAVGLMQVMPATARGFKVEPHEMTDPLTNVRMGVGLLDEISKTLRFTRSVSERDRLSIMLAAYNCGVGRVLDARRLAVKYGENHNSWSVVSKYLSLLDDPLYYGDEVVRCGRFRDEAQTLGFVKSVLRYYDSYRELAAL
jgi:membrane-bound lytic murein transglycosylase F